MNVIFVMAGTKYSPADVNRLYYQLSSHNPLFNYYCYTDSSQLQLFDPKINIVKIPKKPAVQKVWNKLALFSTSFPVVGKNIFFDLDTLVVDNPFKVLDNVDWSKLTLVNCHWKTPNIVRLTNYDVTINSSVMIWDSANKSVNTYWDHFINSGQKDYFLRKYVGIDRYLMHEAFDRDNFAYLPHDYLQSYKYEQPKRAAIITFEEVDFGSLDIESIAKTYRLDI